MPHTFLQDPRDRSVYEGLPLVVMPMHSALAPLEIGRTRIIAGAGGLYIEARSAAMNAIAQLCECPLPYGEVRTQIEFFNGPVPKALIAQARELAVSAMPNEWAGVIVASGDGYELVVPEVLDANRGRVSYATADYDPYSVVLDLHSHGGMPAFFSGQDDRDDRSNPSPVFLAGVFGTLNDKPTSTSRLVINGRFFTLDCLPDEH